MAASKKGGAKAATVPETKADETKTPETKAAETKVAETKPDQASVDPGADDESDGFVLPPTETCLALSHLRQVNVKCGTVFECETELAKQMEKDGLVTLNEKAIASRLESLKEDQVKVAK